MAIATRYVGNEAGMTPFVLDGVGSVTGSAGTIPQQAPGCLITFGGDEFYYCALNLASTTTLTDGQLYVIDRDYNAALLTTTNALRGLRVGVGRVSQANVPAGSHFIWLQVNGQAPIQASANAAANAATNTTATAGQANTDNGTGSKLISGLELAVANGASAGTVEGILRRPGIFTTF